MNSKQEGTLSMSVGIVNFLEKNASITSSLPGFEPLFTKFRINTEGILVLRKQQEIDNSGIKDHKEFLRSNLSAKAYDISRKTEAFATFVNNHVLTKEVHFPETALARATDSKLESRSLIIYEKAKENIADLKPYGVTEDDLTALKNAIDLFHISVPAPRKGTTEKKHITNQLITLFKDNAAILEKIDLLVDIVRLSKPDFYAGYKESRKITVTGTGSLALIAKATDAATGEGIKGVKFIFIPQNGNKESAGAEEPLVKMTARKGILNIKNLSDGTYTAVVAKTGYKQKELTISKAAGDRIKLEVQLERIE